MFNYLKKIFKEIRNYVTTKICNCHSDTNDIVAISAIDSWTCDNI